MRALRVPAVDDGWVCGIDSIDVDAFCEVARDRGWSFLARVFTPSELLAFEGAMDMLALRFAAKEATVKALGSDPSRVRLRDIEVLDGPTGRPTLTLQGTAEGRARELGVTSWAVGLDHSGNVASAMVIGSPGPLPEGAPSLWILARTRRAG